MSEPSCISSFQGPIQAWLRPGQWCFGVRAIRQGEERWACGCSRQQLVDGLEAVVASAQLNALANTRKVRMGKVKEDFSFVRIESYTASAEWLDVTEFHIESAGDGVSVRVKSFSSGFTPTCVPLAPLLSAVCFWVPFSDYGPQGSLNKLRIKEIREQLTKDGLVPSITVA
ncbi:uncharacterized protein MONBRDRAFT_4944 [Monosiga brevicollis MX1]|uniref:Uncharacterized protein n=1 Tax=Monosiga brevicollis TaxID=81824 RepID=A9UPF1_MONBE|nr:uncharacterized protein MONBRDRAFT_4944 [Monosiga brevicollis MX1]EDQ92410.1 predicted protein [Monosiga brevicollis MX1]|eukprot:XP_001742172.1 hypothetical protein [Monosiga brevicollis MX1]